MKQGLLKYSRSKNFGDQVQSLAARRYLKAVDEYLDRDYLNEYSSQEEIKLIMNGWFMAEPENWPPSGVIDPLFVSFHITHDYDANQKLLTEKSLEYFRKHEPIGCRDYYTLDLLKSHGVNSYYSGCLTLTLERDVYSSSEKRNDKIYIVDVLYKMKGSPLKFLKNWKRRWLLKQIIPGAILDQAEYITQVVPKGTSEEEKFKIAEAALAKYADAKLVITSRIHCALPCTAFGTKVLFIDGALDAKTDTTRLKGIADFFNVYKVADVIKSYRGFLTEFFSKQIFKNPLGIDWDNLPENPKKHMQVAEKLVESCENFINTPK